MRAIARTKSRRIAATDALIHFGELLDAVVGDGEVVEVERADDFVVVLTPADRQEPAKRPFDAEAWWSNLKRIHARMRTYREANPITEMPEDILRDFHDSR